MLINKCRRNNRVKISLFGNHYSNLIQIRVINYSKKQNVYLASKILPIVQLLIARHGQGVGGGGVNPEDMFRTCWSKFSSNMRTNENCLPSDRNNEKNTALLLGYSYHPPSPKHNLNLMKYQMNPNPGTFCKATGPLSSKCQCEGQRKMGED